MSTCSPCFSCWTWWSPRSSWVRTAIVSRSSRGASSHGIRLPVTRKIGCEPNLRWMSDALRATPSRRMASSSTFSFLSAPPPPGGLGRPHSFCTRPVAPLGRARAQTELLAHLGLDLHRDLGMLAQEVARVLAALADAVATDGVPGADLHADLVDEDDDGPRLGDGAGQLAERLRHEPRLEAHLRIAHVALDLGARDQGSDRIDDQHVERARAHQGVGDLERLLAVVGLRDEQVLGLDAELARVAHVEGVLRIDEGADAAALLALGDQLERERGLARRLGPVDLDHAPARDAADP